MSDGNFNKALLPHNPLASGLKMGRAQMQAKATKAFSDILTEKFTALPESERAELVSLFNEKLKS